MKTETRTYTLYQTTELSEESKEKGSSSLLMVKSDEERLTQQELNCWIQVINATVYTYNKKRLNKKTIGMYEQAKKNQSVKTYTSPNKNISCLLHIELKYSNLNF